MRIDLNKIWQDQEASSSKQVVREQIDLIENLNCYIGTVGFTNVRMFQLEVDSSLPIHKNYLHRFKGVEMQIIPNKKGTLNEFTILLMERDLTDIFTLFIEDILEKLISISDARDALAAINHRVGFWKKLFAKASGDLLSLERQRGLFGELFVLRLLLEAAKAMKPVLNSWVGSTNSNQDFTLGNNAVEVKTSKAGNPSIIVSNEHQLDFTTWNHIYLCTVLVHETTSQESTLFQLVNSIQELLGSDVGLLTEFEHKLELAGIPMEILDEYNEIGYTIRNYRFYDVREGFPVIIRATLENDAIKNVSYQIDISKCMDFEEEESTVINTLL